METAFTTLKVSAKGQVTLNKTLLAYLGVGPGDQIELNILPGNRVRLARFGPKKEMRDLVGLLKPRSGPPVTDEEIEDGIAQGAVEAYLRGEDDDAEIDGHEDRAA